MSEKSAGKDIDFVNPVSIEVIQPFREKPSMEWQDPAAGTKPREKQLGATDLLSVSTTDINRERIIFTR